ncbi:hypothetical protein H5T58_00855 [Candidatus Parcubacteria bacterium]|nr:hypothetical protein [Candidatus Parcubacteria bacterium]
MKNIFFAISRAFSSLSIAITSFAWGQRYSSPYPIKHPTSNTLLFLQNEDTKS